MPRDGLMRVLRAAAVLALAVPTTIVTPFLLSKWVPMTPLATWGQYRCANGTPWCGKDAPGYSAVYMSESGRRLKWIIKAQQGTEHARSLPAARELPAWFDQCSEGVRERSGRDDDYIVEAFGWPARSLARSVYRT